MRAAAASLVDTGKVSSRANTRSSAATAVALAYVGAHTSTIRIGAGGVMLPNHSPLSVAESFRLLEALVRMLFGIEISADSAIGPGFYIGHSGGIVVHGELGAQCSIGQGVTIGSKGAGRSDGYPRLGHRVYLGAGAMVIGAVRVGDDVVVGANTVVVQDIPAGARVVSAPVRILPRRVQGGTSA